MSEVQSMMTANKQPLRAMMVLIACLLAFLVLFVTGHIITAMGALAAFFVAVVLLCWLPRYLWARWRFGRPRPPFEIWDGAAWWRCTAVIGDIDPICEIMGKSGSSSSLYWFTVTNDDGAWEYVIETCGGGIQGICCTFKSALHAALNFACSTSGDEFIDCTVDGAWSAVALDAMKQAGKPTKHVGLGSDQDGSGRPLLPAALPKMSAS